MKIEDNRTITTKCFKHLPVGQVFCYEDIFYMKTCKYENIYGSGRIEGNSVVLSGLNSGKIFLITGDTIVEIVNATLIVN